MTKGKKDKDKDDKKVSDPYYYLENGLVVFTEAYHLKRGYCCKSACRHCPYGFGKLLIVVIGLLSY
jgi:hypothetical protein